MGHHPLLVSVTTLACAATLIGCATSSAPAAAVAPNSASAAAPAAPSTPSPQAADPVPHRSPAERSVARFDFVISSNEPGQPARHSNHQLTLEEHQRGELAVGSNIPLSPGPGRIDVGLLLRCKYTLVGDKLLLETATELTNPDEGAAIRKIVMDGNALVSSGVPMTVASIEDPTSHKRYEVSVTATRLP